MFFFVGIYCILVHFICGLSYFLNSFRNLHYQLSLRASSCFNPIKPGGGGAQRPRWRSSQLPFINLLFYDAQILWLLVFILKTCSDQILAKLIYQEVATPLFSWRQPNNFEKLLKLTWGINFGSRRTILDIKTLFYKVKPIFRWKYPNLMTHSLF